MDGAQTPAKVRTEIKDRIGVITLNDPATLNAAGIDLMDGLRAAFDAFVAGPNVAAIVITGEGRGTCSSANLSGGGSRITENPRRSQPVAAQGLQPLRQRGAQVAKPLVAAVPASPPASARRWR